MRANSVIETIGNTPHVHVSRPLPDAELWIECERANPGGCIKDRIASTGGDSTAAPCPSGMIGRIVRPQPG